MHGEERAPKRQRTDDYAFRNVGRADEIHAWLEFRQSTDQDVKAGINTFKEFLASINRPDNLAQQATQFAILKEYCQWQRAATEDQKDFYDILSTWSLAVDSNTEAIISAVPAALAQFLKTISGILEMRDYGLALIDSLLKRDLSKLFEKCLVSPRTRPHMASPCLRLLTEMITFDAGARATEFWARRDLFMPKFEAVLEALPQNIDQEERKKPTVRRMALRFLVAMLRYLDTSAKSDLLFQSRVLHKCIVGLARDGEDIVVDILRAFNQYLVDDDNITRSAVARFFNSARLETLATLYSYNSDTDDHDDGVVRITVQKLLVRLCASSKSVAVSHNGWYPLAMDVPVLTISDDDYIDLGLESPFCTEEYKDKIPVTNTALSSFIQKLKPQDSLQSSLLLAVFKASPELVADYFARKRHPPVATSDNVEWRSYFAFLFSVVESPVPEHLGRIDGTPTTPPSCTIVAESILPRPIDRAYLSKMLGSEDEILRISGARLIVVTLKKLEQVLRAFSRYSNMDSQLWQQAKIALSNLIETKVPLVREVNLAVQKHLQDDSCSALLECLLTYHQLLPSAATIAPFDAGPMLHELCSELEKGAPNAEALMDQLISCVKIAEFTTTKWLQKTDNETLSPLIRLIKILIETKFSQDIREVLSTLQPVFVSRGILSRESLSFAAFCTSFMPTKKHSPSVEVLRFVDICMSRVGQKPVKYLDDIEEVSRIVSDRKQLSLIMPAITEQWPYALKLYEADKDAVKSIAAWIARISSLLDAAGENYRVISHFHDEMLRNSDSQSQILLKKGLEKVRKKPLVIDVGWIFSKEPSPATDNTHPAIISKSSPGIEDLEKIAGQTAIPENLSGLDKWPADSDIELELSTRRLQCLITCLTSHDAELRIQSYQTLQHILHNLNTASNYDGKQQVVLILSELSETISRFGGGQQTIPAIIPELANALLAITLQPVHFLFAKVNKFLLNQPSWSPKGVILYWLKFLLRVAPDGDGADVWIQEREWLMRVLVDGLRSEIDLQLYRGCDVWEHVLSLYTSQHASQTIRQLVLALLWKALKLEDGSNLLWTRFGLNEWLSSMHVVDKENILYLQLVQAEMSAKCSNSDLVAWKALCAANRSGVA